MEVQNGSVAGLIRRVKFVSLRVDDADEPRHTKPDDAREQLPRLKLEHVAFATLPLLCE